MHGKNIRMETIESYRMYEKKAEEYFKTLSAQLAKKAADSSLKRDLKKWKKQHRKGTRAAFLFSNKKPDHQTFHTTIQRLEATNKLEPYLDRSISYIYMRDLGKTLYEKDTQEKIERAAKSLKRQLLQSTTHEARKEPDFFDTTWMYRWGEKEGVELTVIWLLNKLNAMADKIPAGLDPIEARRKLTKLVAGVVMHQLDELDETVTKQERAEKLDKAIRIGYAYGLTYPFIDDLLDSAVLTEDEKKTFSHFIRETLLTGDVPAFEEWKGSNPEFIQFVYTELTNAFLYIKEQQSKASAAHFFKLAYAFFESQEKDRVKDLSNSSYTNEELFIPVILKSALSRLIIRSMLSTSGEATFDEKTFYYGIYNQLADDFTDMFLDLEAKRVTPYTYYLTYHKTRRDLINPFKLFWTVISHLIHDVYDSDYRTRDVMLARAINSQKRFKRKIGNEKYKQLMKLFSFGNRAFDKELQYLVRHAEDVDFFDKLLRDHMITKQKQEEKERIAFLETAKLVRKQMNQMLSIVKDETALPVDESIIDAANYSLKNGGKRLRPIMTWFLGVKDYGLDATAMIPLLKSVEYMHTASLIFDDLPSQDDAALRRGQPTVHKVYDAATAELTGLFLTQKAVSEQASLEGFRSEAVLRLIKYSSEVITHVARGQAMDLGSKGKALTIEQLNTICFYKTGIAFEASLIMPAILAEKPEKEMQFLKKYAYHAGIAFQIKDDLLDVEGDADSLGKEAGIDAENQTANFVSVIGVNEAKKAMWEHYCLAMEELKKQDHPSSFLKFFLDYMVQRES